MADQPVMVRFIFFDRFRKNLQPLFYDERLLLYGGKGSTFKTFNNKIIYPPVHPILVKLHRFTTIRNHRQKIPNGDTIYLASYHPNILLSLYSISHRFLLFFIEPSLPPARVLLDCLRVHPNRNKLLLNNRPSDRSSPTLLENPDRLISLAFQTGV
jgi:hypothetical protein